MPSARMVRMIAPFAAIGLTIAVRKGLSVAYRGMTGNEPPEDDDLDANLAQVLAFAVSTAIAVTIVNVAITRGVKKYSHSEMAA